MNFLSAYWRCGPLVIGTAALSFSFTALAIKFIGDAIPPFETVSIAGLLCMTALTVLLWNQGLPLIPRPNVADTTSPLLAEIASDGRSSSSDLPVPISTARVALLTLLRGIFGAVATTSFILSLELLSLKDAVTLFFTSPVIALLLDWVLMGRSPGFRGAAATALTLAGALLVTQPPFLFGTGTDAHPPATGGGDAPTPEGGEDGGDTSGGLSSAGVALALLAAACNASGFLAISLLKGRQHPMALTWWYNLVLMVLTGVPLALHWPLGPVLPAWPREILLVAAVGGTQLAAQLCLNRGFQLEPPGRGAAINVLQVLFSFILDVVVLHHQPSLLSVGGSSLVAAGVLFVALSSDNPSGAKPGSSGGDGESEPLLPGDAHRNGTGGGEAAAAASGGVYRVVVDAAGGRGAAAGAVSAPGPPEAPLKESLLAEGEP